MKEHNINVLNQIQKLYYSSLESESAPIPSSLESESTPIIDILSYIDYQFWWVQKIKLE